eukprot:gene22302-28418_t
MFGDLVLVSDSGQEIVQRLQSMDTERSSKHRLAGLRKVMLEHSYAIKKRVDDEDLDVGVSIDELILTAEQIPPAQSDESSVPTWDARKLMELTGKSTNAAVKFEVVPEGNRNHKSVVPENTTFVRLGWRVMGTGVTTVKMLMWGHRQLAPERVLGRSD